MQKSFIEQNAINFKLLYKNKAGEKYLRNITQKAQERINVTLVLSGAWS